MTATTKMPKLRRERASDSVYQILRDSIMTQVFAPGERLNVGELAAKLDVSPTPVKEAISRLATEGLVAVHPRSGTYVTDLSTDHIAETFEIRLALESLAIERAVRRMTPAALARIRQLVAEMERPAATERERAAHEARNVDFHRLLVELSGNRRLLEMYESLNAHINIARVHRRREGWENRLVQDRAEHREILEAIEAGRAAQAVRALRRHIERAAEDLITDLSTNDLLARSPAAETK